MLRHANFQSRWTMKYRSRSNMDTAVWVVIPKSKLIPTIITVAFTVLGKWTWTLRSKLGLTQILTHWLMNKYGWRNGLAKSRPTKMAYAKKFRPRPACFWSGIITVCHSTEYFKEKQSKKQSLGKKSTAQSVQNFRTFTLHRWKKHNKAISLLVSLLQKIYWTFHWCKWVQSSRKDALFFFFFFFFFSTKQVWCFPYFSKKAYVVVTLWGILMLQYMLLWIWLSPLSFSNDMTQTSTLQQATISRQQMWSFK